MKMVRDRTSPRYLSDKKYKVSLSTMGDWKVGRAHLPGDGVNRFADGSKNREGAGAGGVYGKNINTSLVVPSGPYSTVLQTEIAAILPCACEARNYGRGRNIRIFSDSREAITTLDKSVTTSTLVWKCYETLNKLARATKSQSSGPLDTGVSRVTRQRIN